MASVLFEPLDDVPDLPGVHRPNDEWRWLAEQLLRRSHHELDRADEKINTLFRLYGVVLAAGVGFSVSGYAKGLHTAAATLLLVAAVIGLLAGGMLARALAPRNHAHAGGRPQLAYFGDVVRFPDRDELWAALSREAQDIEAWLVAQLATVSAIVDTRYRLVRRATAMTWIAIALTLSAAVAQRLA